MRSYANVHFWNVPLQLYNILYLYALFQGCHGDTSATFLCGDVDDEAKKLVQVISPGGQF